MTKRYVASDKRVPSVVKRVSKGKRHTEFYKTTIKNGYRISIEHPTAILSLVSS
jgi:hypothetical protein